MGYYSSRIFGLGLATLSHSVTTRLRPAAGGTGFFWQLLAITLLLALAAIGVTVIVVNRPAVAAGYNEAAGRAELERAARSLVPRPSTDPTPIELSIGGIHFRILRNYLITMDNWNGGPQGLVTLRVNIPDLNPLTEETRACFSSAPAHRSPGCEPFSFTINAPGGASAEQAFTNSKDLFHNQVPEEGPSGFEKYESGPIGARAEHYKKVADGRILFYRCQIFDNFRARDGLCYPVGDRVKSGAVLHFYFKLSHLGDIEQIDARLRALVDNFTEEGGDGQ